MYTINQYVKVTSLEEAYELNQKKANLILGGSLWLRLGQRTIQTAIDLSKLGLDKIEETEDAFRIGCMVTLRQIELSAKLSALSQGAIKESLRHIVGTQFRNCATIGGSVFGRFGFSDILTILLALDTEVELYKGGIVSLAEFIDRPKDNDILSHIIIKKSKRKTMYSSFRLSATDFPVLTCAMSRGEDGKLRTVIGARPNKAMLLPAFDESLSGGNIREKINAYADLIESQPIYGANRRGSAQYRRALAGILVKRMLPEVLAEEEQIHDN